MIAEFYIYLIQYYKVLSFVDISQKLGTKTQMLTSSKSRKSLILTFERLNLKKRVRFNLIKLPKEYSLMSLKIH